MKLSQLIAELTAMLQEHGDLVVINYTDDSPIDLVAHLGPDETNDGNEYIQITSEAELDSI